MKHATPAALERIEPLLQRADFEERMKPKLNAEDELSLSALGMVMK